MEIYSGLHSRAEIASFLGCLEKIRPFVSPQKLFLPDFPALSGDDF